MITLQFTNGQEIKTRCKLPATAIQKALAVSPVRGTIAGTKMIKDGKVFGLITQGLGWSAV